MDLNSNPTVQCDSELNEELLVTLRDVETFLRDLSRERLSTPHEERRCTLVDQITEMKKKVKEQLKSHSVNGSRSPRPVRKSCPAGIFKDSLHTYASHLHKVGGDVGQRRSHPGSPEIKRGKLRPNMRPRSVSCPEIRFTLPHSWKTSLAKVPENEELKVDVDDESSDD